MKLSLQEIAASYLRGQIDWETCRKAKQEAEDKYYYKLSGTNKPFAEWREMRDRIPY